MKPVGFGAFLSPARPDVRARAPERSLQWSVWAPLPLAPLLLPATRTARPRRPRCRASEESSSMDFLQKLIQKQRKATELGICTEEWHPELFEEAPTGSWAL